MELNQVLEALDFEPEAEGKFADDRLAATIAVQSTTYNPVLAQVCREVLERMVEPRAFTPAEMREIFIRACLIRWDVTIDGEPVPTTWPEADAVFQKQPAGQHLFAGMDLFSKQMPNFQKRESKKSASRSGGTNTRTKAPRSRGSSKSAKAGAKNSRSVPAAI
jgi:hypothetical protein